MKSSNKIFIFATVILLLLLVAISIHYTKKIHSEDALTEDFFSSDTILKIESINNLNYIKIDPSKEVQNKIQVLLKELNLKRTDVTYSPHDADYRIVSLSNQDNQLYLIVEENVIVSPFKSSTGYKIKSNIDMMKTIDTLLH